MPLPAPRRSRRRCWPGVRSSCGCCWRPGGHHVERSAGRYPLHLAAKINAPHLALLLLQAGADARARNQQGVAFQFYFSQTPAHLQNDELKAQFRELDKWLQGHRLATHYGSRKRP